MKLTKQKLLTIITESILDKRIIADFKDHGASGYTMMECNGEGSRGVRVGDWDQMKNTHFQVVCDEKTATKLMKHIYDEYHENYALIIYLSEVELFRPQA